MQHVLVEVESEFENFFGSIFLVSSQDILGRDDVDTEVPKRIYGRVVSAPTNYKGPEWPINFTLEDLDDAPRTPVEAPTPSVSLDGIETEDDYLQALSKSKIEVPSLWNGRYGNKHPVFEECGMEDIVTVIPVEGTHGTVFYTNTIQEYLQKDDTVWFSHYATNKMRLVGKNLYAIPVNSIYAYKRGDGDFTPFAGKVFLRAARNPQVFSQHIITVGSHMNVKPTSGVVVFKGLGLRGQDNDDLFEVGEEVEFARERRLEVEIDRVKYIVIDGVHIRKVHKNVPELWLKLLL